ncbi:F-box protein interaction domain protein [Medicago truncatula]|uniref:F-box protein interaction domain protein n=1 Tax=Medicago truncatula TaxID=3880 RepID=G7KP90_MEDTR|nr:F-box protein interaction domain protein [Medicago truncatula]
MNPPKAKSSKSIVTQAMSRRVYLPDELIAEVLSFLPVKSLLRLKLVSKSWINLISDPIFVKLHLHRFSRKSSWFRIWNPATGIISEKLGSFKEPRNGSYCSRSFTFGYDNSTGTYKVVFICYSKLKVFSLKDNIWRKISRFPPFDHAIPLTFSNNEGVYLSGTVNWFAIRNKAIYNSYNKDITVEQFMIISLDLGTETYKQFQTPRGVDEVPDIEPTIAVLMDCLCFSHYIKRTHFVIWQMSEFGVEQSWTQFIKISFENVQVDDRFSDWNRYQSFMFPLCLSENGDILILISQYHKAILYHLKDNRVEQASGNEIPWKFFKDYVESLASIC